MCGVLHAETVVVLPFFNHANSQNLDWIGESIAETVQDSLASEGLLVLDREDRLEAYRRLSLRPGAELTHASIIKIGESLDASQVVYGFYELLPARQDSTQSKGSLRITARMLDLKHTRQGPPFSEWARWRTWRRSRRAWAGRRCRIVSARPRLPKQEFLKARPPVRLDAVENYVRGLLAASPEQRQRFFMQAARLDEHYSQPCFQLGKAYWEKKDYKMAASWLARVARSDPHYLEAQFFLGLSRYHNGDFAGAGGSLSNRGGVRAAQRGLQRPGRGAGAPQQLHGRHCQLPEGAGGRQRRSRLSLQPGLHAVARRPIPRRRGKLPRGGGAQSERYARPP